MSRHTNSTLARRSRADVVVVGAGPGGLACAIAAAREGLHVAVVDAIKPPIDKACGEGLMPGSLQSLATLGIDLNGELDQTKSSVLRGIRFISTTRSGDRMTVQAAFPLHPGRGVRRTVLHQLLFDRASELGVRFHWQSSVHGIVPGRQDTLVLTNNEPLGTRYVIGADGLQSRIASWAGLTQARIHSRRIGLRQHYAIAPWTRFVEVYWSDHGQAYVTPISAGEISVAIIANEKIASLEQGLRQFPALQRHLAGAKVSSAPRGSVTLGRTLKRVVRGNIALIGDASGSVDAITGEGLSLCFRQAAALSHALKADNLAEYQSAHRKILRTPTLMSRAMLQMDRSAFLRDRALNLFQRSPKLFSRLLNIHIGHVPMMGLFGLMDSSLDSRS
jgi:flavin-dependent dehydrogenase